MKVKISSSGVAKELTNKIKISSNGTAKECQKIVKIDGSGNEKEIWSNLTAINLGTAKSFNIRTLLPNVDYTQLTTNNFYVASMGSLSFHNYQDDGIYYNWTRFAKSYNANTGVLSCYFYTEGGGTGTPTIYYVNNPNKLVALADMKTKYPTKWQNFTTNNFITLGFGDELMGIGSPYSVNGSGWQVKSYNNSTGALTYYYTVFIQCSRGGDNTRQTHNGNQGVYVVPKIKSL